MTISIMKNKFDCKKYIDFDSKLFKSNTNALKIDDIRKIIKNINYKELNDVSLGH